MVSSKELFPLISLFFVEWYCISYMAVQRLPYGNSHVQMASRGVSTQDKYGVDLKSVRQQVNKTVKAKTSFNMF